MLRSTYLPKPARHRHLVCRMYGRKVCTRRVEKIATVHSLDQTYRSVLRKIMINERFSRGEEEEGVFVIIDDDEYLLTTR